MWTTYRKYSHDVIAEIEGIFQTQIQTLYFNNPPFQVKVFCVVTPYSVVVEYQSSKGPY
jgi:hypothetical protein